MTDAEAREMQLLRNALDALLRGADDLMNREGTEVFRGTYGWRTLMEGRELAQAALIGKTTAQVQVDKLAAKIYALEDQQTELLDAWSKAEDELRRQYEARAKESPATGPAMSALDELAASPHFADPLIPVNPRVKP